MKKNILTVSAISVIISSVFNAEASGQSTANANVENPGVTAPSSPSTPNEVKEIAITDAWARKSMSPNNNSAAYMKISNPTDKDIVIIGASASTIANNVETHIMLFNLKKSLNVGDKFEIEVKIEGRSPLSVATEVKETSLNK